MKGSKDRREGSERSGGSVRWVQAAVLAAAMVLFAAGTVGNAAAALSYYSGNYDLDIDVPSIGVTLEENGTAVAWRNYKSDNTEDTGRTPLLSWAKSDGSDTFQPGKYYTEELAVHNSGSVDSYVKVELYRYWTDRDGRTVPTLSPDDIYLDLGTGDGWYIDYEASTAERTVLYYGSPLKPGERTSFLSSQVMMSNAVKEKLSETTVKEDANGRTFEIKYAYNGVRMYVEAEVYAVQAHNAVDAIKSAWGRSVAVDESGSLQLTKGSGNAGTAGGNGSVNPGTASGTGTGSNGGSGNSGSTGNSSEAGGAKYLLNTSSKRIHLADCEKWAWKVNPNNKEYTNRPIAELQAEGYTCCPDCNPQ